MSRSYNEREKFIEELRETPFISFVCRKMKLSRTTVYRWRKSNIDFREKLDAALTLGRDNVNDMAEACLVQKVRDQDMGAIKFWLQHNNPKYIPVRTVYVEPPHQHGKLRPGVPCKQCGHVVYTGFNPAGEDHSKKSRKQKIKEIVSAIHQQKFEEEVIRKYGSLHRATQDHVQNWPEYDDPISLPIEPTDTKGN
jgi:hypothetical protein